MRHSRPFLPKILAGDIFAGEDHHRNSWWPWKKDLVLAGTLEIILSHRSPFSYKYYAFFNLPMLEWVSFESIPFMILICRNEWLPGLLPESGDIRWRIRLGVAVQLLVNASVIGHKMKLSFFNLLVFWKTITVPANATKKPTYISSATGTLLLNFDFRIKNLLRT